MQKRGWVLIVVAVMMVGSVITVRAEENDGVTRDQIKERRLQLKEAVRQTRAEFRERLQNIKDEKKRLLVERLSEKICDINKKQTAIMIQKLDKMVAILDRVETKAKGNAQVIAAVESARKAVDEAKVAATSQAGKPCGVDLSGTDIGTVRANVAAARKTLADGLKAVHEKVVAARKATSLAIGTLGREVGE